MDLDQNKDQDKDQEKDEGQDQEQDKESGPGQCNNQEQELKTRAGMRTRTATWAGSMCRARPGQ